MADDYFYPWYPAHYRRDAGHLDHLPDSCYRRLIDAYMEGGEPLRKDPIRLMSVMRVTAEQFSMVWPQLEAFFEVLPDGRLRLKRCEVELDRQETLTRQQSAAGKRSAEKRAEEKRQYQLLVNGGSTDVKRPFNEPATALRLTNTNNKQTESLPNGETVPKDTAASRKSASAVTLPTGWTPSPEQVAYAAKLGLVNGAISREVAVYEAYWTIGKGEGTRRTERGWRQTWINWIERASRKAHNTRSDHDNGNFNADEQRRADQTRRDRASIYQAHCAAYGGERQHRPDDLSGDKSESAGGASSDPRAHETDTGGNSHD